jgi:pimeloyl-ACP methyl ester carboxylesterase
VRVFTILAAAAFAAALMSSEVVAQTAAAVAAFPPAQLRVPKTWTDHTFTTTTGVKLHFIEQGQGAPVILIHGLTSSAVGNWFNTGVAQRLAKTNRVIALDMRGHGDTGAVPADAKGDMIGDVVELMNFLKIDKAHIGGYSMGGATTAGLLKRAPERFITASLMGIGVKETPEWEGKGPKDPAAPAGAPPATPRKARSAAGYPTPDRGAPPGAPVANQDVDLTRIKFPVLSINGSNDYPLSKTHRMWRELEDYTYIVIPGRNHMQASSDPLFGEKLAQFIVAHNPK